MQDPLNDYVANLLQKAGQPDTEESRAELLEKVYSAIDEALLLALPAEQLKKLEAADRADEVDEDAVGRLLAEANVDSSAVAKKALADFEDTYLKGARK